MINKLKNIEVIKKKDNIILSKEEKLKLKQIKKEKKQELKELRKENKNILPSNKDILPFIDIDDDEVFITKQGFMNIYQINTRDISNLSDFEIRAYIYNFIYFLRNYIEDFKIIVMNFPVNTVKQQDYIRKKIENTNNETYIKFLNEKLEELIFLEKHRNNKEFFLMIFMKDKIEKENLTSRIDSIQNVAMTLKDINLEKKIKIIFKLCNLNTKLM